MDMDDIANFHTPEDEPEGEPYYSESATKMDAFLYDMISNGEVRAADMLLMMMSLFIRLRSALTMEELQAWIMKLHMKAEIRLQEGRAFHDGQGNTLNMLTAEERRATGLTEVEVPDTVPEDWV